MLNSLGGPSDKICSSAKFVYWYSWQISPVRVENLLLSFGGVSGVFWDISGVSKGLHLT